MRVDPGSAQARRSRQGGEPRAAHADEDDSAIADLADTLEWARGPAVGIEQPAEGLGLGEDVCAEQLGTAHGPEDSASSTSEAKATGIHSGRKLAA